MTHPTCLARRDMPMCECRCRGRSILLFTSPRQDRLFGGVSGTKPAEPGTTKPSVGKCSRNTHDHTASKGVSDRLPMGITQASSTFGLCSSSECCRGIPPKGREVLDKPARHRRIHNQASWPAPDRRDIRGRVWVKETRQIKAPIAQW